MTKYKIFTEDKVEAYNTGIKCWDIPVVLLKQEENKVTEDYMEALIQSIQMIFAYGMEVMKEIDKQNKNGEEQEIEAKDIVKTMQDIKNGKIILH